MFNPTSLTLDGVAMPRTGRSAIGTEAPRHLCSSDEGCFGSQPPAPPVHGPPIGSCQHRGRTPDHALKVAYHPPMRHHGHRNASIEIGQIANAAHGPTAAAAVPITTAIGGVWRVLILSRLMP
jgi:hypothetical protein